MALLKT